MGTRCGFAVEKQSQCKQSFRLLTVHRELLVARIKNIQCVLDNLVRSGFFCTEDAEIILRFSTKTDQVRKILELVQSKGEEVCQYFVHILHEAYDAFIDLRPWFKEIQYQPSEQIQSIPVINTDPVSKYCEKLRHELGQDTKFIISYAQREETLLDEMYTDTLMELVNDRNESQGYLDSLDELFSDNGVFNKDAETILILGDAGTGKSILLQKLQNLWSKREPSIPVKFFFKFRCRMFCVFKETDEISLKDLLFKYNCYPDKDPEDEVFKYLQRFPEMVLFTFDGYDEIHSDFDLSSIPEVCSPDEKTHPLLLLMNLLGGKLLKGSKKVLTARTGTEIQNKVIRKKLILKGFSPESLRKYTTMHFKERTYQTLVLNQLEANPHLCSLCSIPLFCWIIFKCFEHFQSVYDNYQLTDLYVTITDVFLLMSEVFLSRLTNPSLLKKSSRCQSETFKSGRETLIAFGKLAHQGTEKTSFVFDQEEITSLRIAEKVMRLGFLRPIGHYDGCGNPTTFEFVHVTLQSFFTAFSLVADEDVGSKDILKFFAECEYRKAKFPVMSCLRPSKPRDKDPFKNNEHFQFTNLFLCGLLSRTKVSLLEHLVSPKMLKKKREVLKSYLSDSVKSHLKNLPRFKSEQEGCKVHGMPNFIWMLRCIFETQSEEVGKLTAKGISADYIKLTYCNAYSADCSAFNFVLQHCRKQIGLDLDNNNINDYGVKQLQPCFSKLSVVRLCVNQVTDCGVEVLAKELVKTKIVKVLGLYKNQITDAGAQWVAKIIEECPSLRILKIGCNKITSKGGKLLAYAIQKSKTIFDVGMWGNTIGDEGAIAFAEALRNHPSLTNLSLSANLISTEGGKSLAAALKENTSVNIFWLVQNELNDEVARCFAETVKVNTALTHLWLIDNKVTVEGAKILSQALLENKTLKEICLKGNLLSLEEEKAFTNEKRLFFN
ncbi:nucleotide-binding oligomerization domain-containing protein 1 isoform X1 [Acipenser ruthenus]|uniref:nucleotide-binding oligomerization domain-containing protein 1 isoform X1 n=2 Tax=Acipenser ruthenus TaxID=7906 RepID=UPI00274074E7|nr:nucleotide-binding oligomerization domain-containing protein 1 isoform X1 [Acipenser ruthenus]XP_058868824.1 nucleotide-binding oligomerization domain-containing protein 1 isoform X1 [Acipenser ruthenus]